MSIKLIVSFLLGLAIGVVITPRALAEVDEPTTTDWCFKQEFVNRKDFVANRTPDLDHVLIEMNGKRLKVYTKCQ